VEARGYKKVVRRKQEKGKKVASRQRKGATGEERSYRATSHESRSDLLKTNGTEKSRGKKKKIGIHQGTLKGRSRSGYNLKGAVHGEVKLGGQESANKDGEKRLCCRPGLLRKKRTPKGTISGKVKKETEGKKKCGWGNEGNETAGHRVP